MSSFMSLSSSPVTDSESADRPTTPDATSDAIIFANALRDAAGVLVDFVITDANVTTATKGESESAPTLVGRRLTEVLGFERDSVLWEHCCRVLASRVAATFTEKVVAVGDIERWIERYVAPHHDGVALSIRDVTPHQRIAQQLAASEARHAAQFASSPAVQLIVDEHTGRIIDANPAAERFYGWTTASMGMMQLADLDRAPAGEWRIARDRREHRTAVGGNRQVDVSMSSVIVDGVAARHLIVHEVTDSAHSQAQIRELEARFQAVLDAMTEGVVVHDHLGAIRAFNESAQRILALSADELTGLIPISRDWHAVHEDGSEWPPGEHPGMIALATGEAQRRALLGIRRGDAEQAWLQVAAVPLTRDGERKPYGSVAVFADVTVQRGAEERLREAQKLEAIGQLAGGIAHDFNNLLTVIRGASGFLLDSLPAHSAQIEDVKSIERAAERAEALTRRLLAIGRRQLLRTESVDLSALVQDQFANIRNDMPRTIRVQLALSDEPVIARLDRRQVHDALRALVDNARRAMPDGGTLTLATSRQMVSRPIIGTLPAEVRDRAVEAQTIQKHYAVLEVRDTGEGMSDEVRARLFEPFFSTQPFGTSRGMGLASVHGMVAQSNGFIECDSAPGKGTSLRMFFPLASNSERQDTPPTSTASVASRTVMIVDDDPMLRELGRRMLEKLGYTIVVASSGHDALQRLAAQSTTVSAIVTDLTMPGMTGMELIAELERRHPRLPTVAMSGFVMNPSVRQELEARRIPFVSKPFVATDLSRAIERAHAQWAAASE